MLAYTNSRAKDYLNVRPCMTWSTIHIWFCFRIVRNRSKLLACRSQSWLTQHILLFRPESYHSLSRLLQLLPIAVNGIRTCNTLWLEFYEELKLMCLLKALRDIILAMLQMVFLLLFILIFGCKMCLARWQMWGNNFLYSMLRHLLPVNDTTDTIFPSNLSSTITKWSIW